MRLHGLPDKAVVDRERRIAEPRRGDPPPLGDDIPALLGPLLVRPGAPRPRLREGKGQDERTVGYLQI